MNEQAGNSVVVNAAPASDGTHASIPTREANTAASGTGPRVHFVDSPHPSSRTPILAAPPPSPRDTGGDMDIGECMSPAERERYIEEKRKFDSIKGLLLETINILFREYHVRGLKFFRRRVEDALTLDELKVSSDMLMTLGRFHEVATPPSATEDDRRE